MNVRMRKIIALICIFVLLVPNFVGCTENVNAKNRGIVISSTTPVNSDFIDGWSNTSANAGVKQLIHGGLETVVYTKDGSYQWNDVAVKSHTSKLNENGTLTFTIEINQGLVFNDGSKITAEHYVFQLLLYSSHEFNSLKGINITGQDVYVGYEDQKILKCHSGIKLIDEYIFSLTVKAEEQPYFYSDTFARVSPFPIEVIAPNCHVKDDGNGAYIDGDFSYELLVDTVLKNGTGYRFSPKVTSGPYQFVSHNKEKNEVVLEINENFVGMYDGTIPSIEKITIKTLSTSDQMESLLSGSVDLITSVADVHSIEMGILVQDEKKIDYNKYGKNGYGHLTFHCDKGPTQFVEVRQAISLCIDKKSFCDEITEGHGDYVYSAYGLGQAEYVRNQDWLEENLQHFDESIDDAIDILEKGGWIYGGENGEEYSGNGTRYKRMTNGEYMPLEIQWLATEPNMVTSLLEEYLLKNAMKAGIEIVKTGIDFSTMLKIADGSDVYGVGEFHMFNRTTSFATISTPWFYYAEDQIGGWNKSRIVDQELILISEKMKNLNSGDTKEWDKLWRELMVRVNELCIVVPLYSNIEYDFYDDIIENYDSSSLWKWSYALPWATFKV